MNRQRDHFRVLSTLALSSVLLFAGGMTVQHSKLPSEFTHPAQSGGARYTGTFEIFFYAGLRFVKPWESFALLKDGRPPLFLSLRQVGGQNAIRDIQPGDRVQVTGRIIRAPGGDGEMKNVMIVRSIVKLP